MKRISLTKGKYTIVDSDVYEWASKFKWYFETNGYACRKPKIGKIYLHRAICKPPKNKQVDHINGNRLNNLRFNLRIVSIQNNRMNRAGLNHSSKYKGVTKRGNKWIAQIQFKNTPLYLGIFRTEKDAALEYNKAALKYHKKYARLNEVKE